MLKNLVYVLIGAAVATALINIWHAEFVLTDYVRETVKWFGFFAMMLFAERYATLYIGNLGQLKANTYVLPAAFLFFFFDRGNFSFSGAAFSLFGGLVLGNISLLFFKYARKQKKNAEGDSPSP